MNGLISVVIPAYNIASWLPRCLDSVICQTYQNLEIIVIDDGSTDATSQILDDYANRDKRIIAVHQSNSGLVSVRNTGISMAHGEFIAFIDGDDAVEPDIYERLLNNARKYDADISHCGVAFCFPDGRIEEHHGSGKIVIQDNFTGLKDLLEGTLVEPGLWNKLYKAELLADSCLDESVLNNEDLLRNFVAFSRANVSVFEDFCGYKYYQRDGSMSKDRSKAIRIEQHIQRARRIIVENASPEVYPYAMRTWLSSYVNAVNALNFHSDKDSKVFCQECRLILKQEKHDLHYLIPRQRFAARLILLSLGIHRMVYGVYRKRYE